jgi:hypothetical protein
LPCLSILSGSKRNSCILTDQLADYERRKNRDVGGRKKEGRRKKEWKRERQERVMK